jgi:hypothetical protein
MAKPMPCAWPPPRGLTAASIGMPITRPLVVTSAPPLLPGLIGALVWIASGSAAAGGAGHGRLDDHPAGRGDDALGDAAGQAQRVADREDDIPGPGLAGVAEPGRGQSVDVLGPDHRQIALGVAAHQARRGRAGSRRRRTGPRGRGSRHRSRGVRWSAQSWCSYRRLSAFVARADDASRPKARACSTAWVRLRAPSFGTGAAGAS